MLFVLSFFVCVMLLPCDPMTLTVTSVNGEKAMHPASLQRCTCLAWVEQSLKDKAQTCYMFPSSPFRNVLNVGTKDQGHFNNTRLGDMNGMAHGVGW